MLYRQLTEKDIIFRNVWKCAFKRMKSFGASPRAFRELETVNMCLNIARWWEFDSEKR